MNLQEKLNVLEEIMDVDEGTLEEGMLLEEIDEWDSLSALSLTVMVKREYGISLSTEKIRSFVTVRDICDIME